MPKSYANYDHAKYLTDLQHQEDCRQVFGGTSPLSSPPSPPPSRPLDPRLPLQLELNFVSDVFHRFSNTVGDMDKAQAMSKLMTILNTPASPLGDLSLLHWLGLNPLVILGAPTGHLSPALPSPPPDTTLTDHLTGVVHSAIDQSLQDITAGMYEASLEMEKSFSDINRKLNFLARQLLTPSVPASNPSSPPSSTPVAAQAQDVEMAHPPAPAPVVAPVAAPVVAPPAPAPAAPMPAPAAPPPVSKPRAKKPSAPLPTPVPAKAQPASAKAKSAPAPTPAPVTHPTPPPASKPSFASMAKTPVRPSLVVSLRPPVAGATIPQAVRRSPQEIVGHLNAVLSSEGHQVTLSAAWWTAKNNLVVTAGPDTMAHHLTSSSHLISDCLATYLSADQSPLPVQARENCKWARLLINSIPTGVSLTRGPYTSSELTAALHADNPVCRGLRMTLPPSWVRAPALYTPGSTSSVVLTFEDPSGDSLRSLLAERTLFAFGHSGELKRWKAQPRKTGKGTPAASS
ncbi:hypothetical protein EDB89DRAFT_2066072 [Lactarius sanguifluus]|nr:hypothetical protein EDB89DRAFT_2066072 [Lactarius sanguifluus]